MRGVATGRICQAEHGYIRASSRGSVHARFLSTSWASSLLYIRTARRADRYMLPVKLPCGLSWRLIYWSCPHWLLAG